MTTALYRRYRPEAFGEMIGQSQVTEPLMTALRGDRVGHAYLFSGPRGCGKTTSARILARCLNCAQGPTDTPCGTCDSCVELGRGGGGSLDVVEIDAASHNGVDDARDLRERAVFAPARDRYKIFILDEAHMVTQQGFNALLKLVEEPPDHVKFIFATTEPEKVLGTIRSRTHHYPFRLVPPAAMLDYVAQLCESEGVQVEAGVLPLVVRAGGGSPRDTLSLLDQLIAGSEGGVVAYDRAVALLGYTPGALLDEIVDALGGGDAASAFAAVDRVVQTGQDPRRFVEDLLERLRDLIVIAAVGRGATAVLRGVSEEEIERMSRQATTFGASLLSRIADVVVAALDEMSGATSPRLQLELMIARVLTQGEAAVSGVAAAAAPAAPPATSARASEPAPAPAGPSEPAPVRSSEPVPATEPTAPVASAAAVTDPVAPVRAAPTGPLTTEHVRDAWTEVLARLETIDRTSWLVASSARVVSLEGDVLTLAFTSQTDLAAFKKRTAGAGPSEDLRQAISGVLGIRVKYIARHEGDGPADGASAPEPPAPRGGVAATPPSRTSGSERPTPARASAAAAASVTDWAVAPIPGDDEAPSGVEASAAPRAVVAPPAPQPIAPEPVAPAQFAVDDEPEDAVPTPDRDLPPRDGDVLPSTATTPSVAVDEDDDVDDEFDTDAGVGAPPVIAPPTPRVATGPERYGEAVVRQLLDARFVGEEPYSAPTRFA
ncbi:MAG: DNA polymerase III subunit gamma and tau [Microbacterium sp.]|uniref:DNA polymerase III subunit gamma/tau n=1 Tax=Microbacterium ginsengisoli TaxID=400772 RepID=A0A0F0M2R5_9MICO|nr:MULTISPECIES: DNA polymerase III subunit gamma and tau [Microbacterium]KJL40045.1 DNA polymerase III subunit tau [Microbacterium ginsengisoli]MAL07315.1 DNA polymerase III subunit gamma and tau [Microbacterium sp.]MBN9209422.1 DNA polymerase III subunit gamma and tau [Microbacterium ginsengisoli]MCK9915375.1 DNA polymerase III subunit gamma and tau [Microbacteriaceae bacterium K1510]